MYKVWFFNVHTVIKKSIKIKYWTAKKMYFFVTSCNAILVMDHFFFHAGTSLMMLIIFVAFVSCKSMYLFLFTGCRSDGSFCYHRRSDQRHIAAVTGIYWEKHLKSVEKEIQGWCKCEEKNNFENGIQCGSCVIYFRTQGNVT